MSEQNIGGFFEKVREKSESLMRRSVGDVRDEAVLGNSIWPKIGKAMLEAALTASVDPLSAAGRDLLVSLVGVEDAQTALLRSIDHQVSLTRSGPFCAGRLLLAEVARVGSDSRRANEFLKEAQQRFYDAHGLALSLHERGLVELHLGITWFLLRSPEDSRHWLTRSHASLMQAAGLLAQVAGNVTVLQSRTAVGFASYFYPVGIGVLAAKVRKVRRAERAARALAALSPVIDAVSRAAAVTGERGLPGYTLVLAGETWILRPTAP